MLARAAMTDDDICLAQGGVELLGVQEVHPRADRAHRGGAGLHEEPGHLRRMSRQPVIGPANQPVERMVIGPDDQQDPGPGRLVEPVRHWRHSRHPITLPRG